MAVKCKNTPTCSPISIISYAFTVQFHLTRPQNTKLTRNIDQAALSGTLELIWPLGFIGS